jgi:hypothetical protein
MESTFRHRMHRLSEPEQFGMAMSGMSLAVDFLSPRKMPTCVEQFQSRGWAMDFQEAQVGARISGPPPPGWATLAFRRKSGGKAA